MIGLGLREIVLSALWPSGKKKKTNIKMIQVIAANAIKTVCHPQVTIIKLPAVGASNGDTPKIKTRNEITLALFSTGKKSLTIAIAATDATQPPMACIKRITQSPSMVFVVKQPMVARMYKIKPTYKGGFLPKRSNSGP